MKGNEPAFPGPDYIVKGKLTDEGIYQLGQVRGLSKREYFAALAMQGLMAYPEETSAPIAILAVKMADALLAALEDSQ